MVHEVYSIVAFIRKPSTTKAKESNHFRPVGNVTQHHIQIGNKFDKQVQENNAEFERHIWAKGIYERKPVPK